MEPVEARNVVELPEVARELQFRRLLVGLAPLREAQEVVEKAALYSECRSLRSSFAAMLSAIV
jgi:hypothetical protein